MVEDEDFNRAVSDIREGFIDFAEMQLFKLIQMGHAPSIYFYLKTKGKHRGYVERKETENVNVNYNLKKELDEVKKKYIDIRLEEEKALDEPKGYVKTDDIEAVKNDVERELAELKARVERETEEEGEEK